MVFLAKKAFTFIELLVSITIFFILVSITYIPYNFYMNKAKVRNTIKEISQNLYEARNMAINWISNWISNWWNKSIWLYIDLEKSSNTLNFYLYPYFFTWAQITNTISSDIELLKTYTLIEGMQIKSIAWQNNWLFLFEAITWNWKYFYWDSLWNKQNITNNEIQIDFSFKDAIIWSPLYWKLNYFTKTNIVDY